MKKNINLKKTFSGLLTGFALLSILALNCSFISFGEEIISVKISTPSRSMIRKADKEIHFNMNEMIKELNSFHIPINDFNSADQEIYDQFNNGYTIILDLEKYEIGDYSLTAQFEAENINLNLGKYVLNADNLIFNQFYLNHYTTIDPTIITEADALITDSFQSANN